MSINDFMNKIKGKIGIDKTTLMYLFIIVGVGISSFGLGRLSVNNNLNEPKNQNVISTEPENILKNQNIKNNEIFTTTSISSTEKRYVASKNGKMYYSLGCSGAKRIKSENQIWFSTKENAEKSGYTLSSTCK